MNRYLMRGAIAAMTGVVTVVAGMPTGALDSKTSRQVMGFLQDINQDGTTVVMITHDNALALEAKRVIRISDGRVVFDGKTEDYAKFI